MITITTDIILWQYVHIMNQKILCDIVGDGAFDVPKIKLSQIGGIVEKYILSTNNITELTVDKYVIMPNYIHLIFILAKSKRDVEGAVPYK